MLIYDILFAYLLLHNTYGLYHGRNGVEPDNPLESWATIVCLCVQLSDINAVMLLHTFGSSMAFGLGIVYIWMHVPLSFITLRRLSSLLVCWTRVALAIIVTVMMILHSLVLHLFSQRRFVAPEVSVPSMGNL